MTLNLFLSAFTFELSANIFQLSPFNFNYDLVRIIY